MAHALSIAKVIALIIVAQLLCAIRVSGIEVASVLADDHESFAWRRAAGAPKCNLHRVLIWTRHEQVGIGNTLGGYATSMFSALAENRTLVIRSIILQKFCDIVQCAIKTLPGG